MIRLLPLLSFFIIFSVSAGDRVLNFSLACKVYKLEGKNWKLTDPLPFQGYVLSDAQVLKDEFFTVFKTEAGTYGVSQRCLDGRTEWATAFFLGMNLSPKGTVVSTVAGTSTTADVGFKNTVAFAGGVSYRLTRNLRISSEIGLSQLAENSARGNETSYFHLNPELLLPITDDIEFHLGPSFGLFFFSQNKQADAVYSFPQQSASSMLLGLNAGADYSLTSQFDLGILFQYLKPGPLKITGTRLADSEATEAVLSVSYLMLATRFTIHF